MDVQRLQQWAGDVEADLQRLVGAGAGAGPSGAGTSAPVGVPGLQPFLEALPPGYQESTSPVQAARDLLELSQMSRSGVVHFLVSDAPATAAASGTLRLRRIAPSPVELSALVAVLEGFGLSVLEAVPWRFAGLGPSGGTAFVDDIGLRLASGLTGFDRPDLQKRLVDAIQAVLAGAAEQCELNRLVLSAGLGWRDINLLSAYRGYRQIVGGARAAERAEAMVESLVAYPSVAAAAVGLCEAWLCPPRRPQGATGDGGALDRLNSALAGVPDLAHFEALQELASLIRATARSNWALDRETVAIKLRSSEVPFLPLPRPFAEVFVWSPKFLGIHLRFGPVARGGLRWSERHSDLRAEVLELARAQVKKNSLIVPTGAKGGFVLRHTANSAPGTAGAGDETAAREAYRSFVSALLDLTDNIYGGEVRPPAGVVCRDGPDPYLVVAPDKGTATFSDLANEISAQRGYWLGDAFASGGSHGYDHKALGITARGAWLAVRRHFRALGMDVQRDPLRTVGVGDMSGDVFGNGMLQSQAIRLVAAFDHRHIFVDPDPPPGRAFEERRRLQKLPHSSWADYDLSAASKGAGVYSRQDKQLEIPEQAARALGIPTPPSASSKGEAAEATTKLTPPQLVRAVLTAPVDLVYFGGVGTFVKAPGERDVEVDDEANDDVRITSDRLRARVVAEGANLAMTQGARSGYARRGGRVNTDFVDNAAGVAMSDREVNIKILLGLAGRQAASGLPARDLALDAAKAGAAEAVLADVEQSIVSLDRAASTSGPDLAAWEAAMADFEAGGLLDREVESLPGPEELARRREAGAGFTRPELAVLLAYARSELARSIEASTLVSDPALLPVAVGYFPPPLGQGLSGLVASHPLFKQIVSSQLANEVIARMGGLWAHEASSEACAPPWQAAAAYWTARQVLGLAGLYEEIDRTAPSFPLDAELELRALLTEAAGRLARWYLANDLSACRPVGELVERDRPFTDQVVQPRDPDVDPALRALVDQGVPQQVARLVQGAADRAAVGELGEVARASGRPLEEVTEAHRLVEVGLGLAKIERAVAAWDPPDRWERRQRHAILEDLASLRASATTSALVSYPALGSGPGVEQWLSARRDPLSKALPLVQQLAASERPNVALASAALRAVEIATGRDKRL